MYEGGIIVSLKSAMLQLKDAIVEYEEEQLTEEFVSDMEAKNGLRAGVLVSYLNQLIKLNIKIQVNDQNPQEDSKKINRKWSKNEIEFMFQYIKDRQDEGALNITEILEEISQILNRGYQSVNYKYYTLIKKHGKNLTDNEQKNYQFTTISETKIPVIATELMGQPFSNQQVYQVAASQDDDLLDILSGLITNTQQLPGINLNDLLRSIYQLTNMALQNQDAAVQIESIKTEISREKVILQEQLKENQRQLAQERKRNDQLEKEFSSIANEIEAFNRLSDGAKIQNLKSFNQRLNNLVSTPEQLQQMIRTV